MEEKKNTDKTSIQTSTVKFMNWPLTSNNDPRVKQGSSDSQLRSPADGSVKASRFQAKTKNYVQNLASKHLG